jgi:hypothetical protein
MSRHTYIKFLEKILDAEQVEVTYPKLVFLLSNTLNARNPNDGSTDDLSDADYMELLSSFNSVDEPSINTALNVDRIPESKILLDFWKLLMAHYEKCHSTQKPRIVLQLLLKNGPKLTHKYSVGFPKITSRLTAYLKTQLSKKNVTRLYSVIKSSYDTNNDLLQFIYDRDYTQSIKYHVTVQDQQADRSTFGKFDVQEFEKYARCIKDYEIFRTTSNIRPTEFFYNNTSYKVLRLENGDIFDVVDIDGIGFGDTKWSERLQRVSNISDQVVIRVDPISFEDILKLAPEDYCYLRTKGFGVKKSWRNGPTKRKIPTHTGAVCS